MKQGNSNRFGSSSTGALLLMAGLVACHQPPTALPPAQASTSAAVPAAASAPAPDPAGEKPRFRKVHIDVLSPAKVDQFVQARKDWLEAEARADAYDGRVFFLQVDNHRLYSMRPFSTFSDLDRFRAMSKAAIQKVAPEALKRYDLDSDTALVPPHLSEIWVREEGMDYAVPGGKLDESNFGYALMEVEEYFPYDGGKFEKAWDDMRKALTEAKYPVPRISYDVYYGQYRLISLWLAGSKGEFLAVPSPEDYLASKLGKARSEELFARLRASVASWQTFEAIARRDLSDPEYRH